MRAVDIQHYLKMSKADVRIVSGELFRREWTEGHDRLRKNPAEAPYRESSRRGGRTRVHQGMIRIGGFTVRRSVVRLVEAIANSRQALRGT